MSYQGTEADMREFTDRGRVTETGCWEWLGALSNQGYGRVGRVGKTGYVHRLSYQHFIGPIPDGMHLDHLCRNRACFNPAHLEVVTCRENFLRGVHRSAQLYRANKCLKGHDLTDPNNVYIRPDRGKRTCRACGLQRAAERKKTHRQSRGPRHACADCGRETRALSPWCQTCQRIRRHRDNERKP